MIEPSLPRFIFFSYFLKPLLIYCCAALFLGTRRDSADGLFSVDLRLDNRTIFHVAPRRQYLTLACRVNV